MVRVLDGNLYMPWIWRRGVVGCRMGSGGREMEDGGWRREAGGGGLEEDI